MGYLNKTFKFFGKVELSVAARFGSPSVAARFGSLSVAARFGSLSVAARFGSVLQMNWSLHSSVILKQNEKRK